MGWFLFAATFEMFADLRANLIASLLSHRSRPLVILVHIEVLPSVI